MINVNRYGYIYLILNKVNGKTYIGQRKSNKAWNEDKYMGSGCYLANAKKKYGINNFEKFLLQYVYSLEEANEREIFWIAEYRRHGKAEYNVADGGSNIAWNKGKHASEETKRKMSEVRRGEGNGMFGRKNPSLSQLNISRRGKHLSEETKRKLSEAHKGNKGSKGLHWYTNGSVSVKAKTCPEGFRPGRVYLKEQ